MTKRDEAIEAMGFAAWMSYCGYGTTRPEPEYDGDDTPEQWDSLKNNWDEIPTLCTHIGRDGFIRCATAAFDAVIRVLMEPDKAMTAAGRREVRAFDHRFDEGEVAAERTLQAMLREAAK